ncbi:MAG TPA: hypothetical protein VEY09_10540 [Pyrinomonadaceae bacterium]|nr:hypothetical protein [Pyrinomonadaceae bacterium]
MKLRIHGLALAALLLCGAAAARAQQPTPAPAPAQPPAPAPAQPPPAAKAGEKLPTVEEVMASYEKALGGAEALAKYRSRVMKGTIELAPMGARGTVEVSQKAPDKMLSVMNLAGFGEVRQGYDGQVAWAKDPFQGLREMKGAELATLRRSAVFDLAERNALYKKMAVTGRGKVGEREVYVVEATPAEGEPDMMYFDAQTGLMLRSDVVVDGPQGRVVSENYMEDYRAVDGVQLPHTVRQVLGAITVIQRIESVTHDAALDDSIFRKPSA